MTFPPYPPGTVVQWAHPTDPDEAADRHVIVEDNGDRVLIAPLVWPYPIRPLQTVATTDVVPAGPPANTADEGDV